MNRITVLLCFLLSVIFTYGQEVTIGDGTVVDRYPMGALFGYERSAALYTATEINQIGFINKLAWDVGSTSASRPIKIYLKEVEATTLVANNWANFTTDATLVYDGVASPVTTGFYTLNLLNSFNYTGGTKNLLVLVETNYGGSGGGGSFAIKRTAATNMHFFKGKDDVAPTEDLTAVSGRPNLRLTFGNEITCQMPTNLSLESSAGTSLSINWTAATGVTDYDVYIGTAITEPTADATVIPVTGTTHTFEGLLPVTQYYIWVRSHCSDTDQSFWMGPLAARTKLVPVNLPYENDFEGATNFDFTNDAVNKWHVGTAVSNGGTKSLYISKDNGVTNEYNFSGEKVSQTFTDIAIPTGTEDININFDWRCKGEGFASYKYDYFRVWIVPSTFTPTAGTQITAATDRIQVGRTEYNDSNVFVNENIIFNANAFAGQNMRLVFEWKQDISGGNQPPAAIDNLYVGVITCSQPTALTLDTTTGNSLQVNWPAVDGVTSYDVYIGTTPDRPATDATVISVTGTTHTFEGLDPFTQYYIWVRSHCSDTDQSLWVGLEATTTLIAVPIPYTEDFEAAVTYGYSNDSTNKWYIGNATNNGGTKALYISNDAAITNAYTQSVTGGQTSHAFKDFIIPTGVLDLEIAFDWRCVGEGTTIKYDYFRVWAVPASFIPVAGTQITAAADRIQLGQTEYNLQDVYTSEEIINDLAVFAGQTMRLVFEWKQDGSGGANPPAAIDNLSINAISCNQPRSFTLGETITDSEITVNWTGAPGVSSYDVYISQNATAPAEDATVVNVTGLTHTFTDLEDGTVYYIWVRSHCSATDQSYWVGPLEAVTKVIPVALPFTDNFEEGSKYGYVNDPVNKWVIGTATSNGGTKALYITDDNGVSNHYETSGSRVTHVYKDFIIPTGVNDLEINFDWRCMGEGTSTRYDYFRVWAVPVDFTPVVGTQITAAANRIQVGQTEYNQNEVYLAERIVHDLAVFAGQNMRLVFEWRQDYSGGAQPPAAIDNLSIKVVTCSAPRNAIVTAVTQNTVTVSWTAVAGQTNYEVYYATTNTPPGEEVTGSIETTDIPYTITGLTPNTEYFIWVRTICSATDKSSWERTTAITGQVPGELPYNDDFEGEDGWTKQSNAINKWVVGTAVQNGGTKSLYITKDEGVTNTYSNSTTTVAHAYRDITIPADASEARLTFDWRAKGESCCDYIRVWAAPVTFNPIAGTQIVASGDRIQIGGNYNMQEDFVQVSESFDVINYAGRNLRLIFEWRNDSGGGSDPAGAIDNVKVEQITCPRVTGLSACAGSDYINYGWDSQEGMSQWDIALETTDLPEPNPANIQRVDEPNYTANGLTVATTYYFYVRNICSPTTNSEWRKIKVRTNSASILDAEPFCAGPEGIIFPNNNKDNGAEEYPYEGAIACVTSVRFPIWYFLKVDQDGELIFDIIQNSRFDDNGDPVGTGMDVDFVAFGPFENLEQACGEAILGPCTGCTSNSNPNDGRYPMGNLIDCNYSASPIETLTIRNARRGQIYAVLITNYDRGAGFIKLVQKNANQNNAGTTDCKFLCEVDLGPDQYLCPGTGSHEIVANISAAGSTEDMTYTWFKDGEMLDPTIFNTKKLIVSESGTYRVKVEKDLCEENPEDEIIVKFYDPISLGLPTIMQQCDLENEGFAFFDVKDVVESAIERHTESSTIKHEYYHSLEDLNARRNAFEIDDLYQSAGDETIYVDVYRDKNYKCGGHYEIELKIKATAYFNADFSYDAPICINNVEELPITPGPEFTLGGKFTYKTISHTNAMNSTKEPKGGLSLNASTGAINVEKSTPGVYEVKYFYGVPASMCGDDVEHTVTITIFEQFEIAIDGDCFEGDYYLRVIDVLNNIDMDHAKFEWVGPGGFTADTREITVSKEGEYTVYIETKEGCYEEQSITLKADEINCLITRGISPNGDGLNDYFDLINYKVKSFKVFNRNGGEVYSHGLGYTREWMGQDKSGNKLPSGTYFYVIETVQKTITGWVQINY
ncbi:fibronectin type III domain-containing protein [Myroides sp. DW712]|uniref:fibronectin type III domain-containing protein n=1 Tax=Myroides sp. DW712 TaxID=3389800 RepID=UPI00397DF7C5